jgi:hypothetical protein
LEVPYFHVVFTLPPKIAVIAYQNKAVIYDLLFKASAETLLTIAADPKRLGVKIGFTSVLHTWGSAMTHHPHVHMIVPGGGISLDGSRWISSALLLAAGEICLFAKQSATYKRPLSRVPHSPRFPSLAAFGRRPRSSWHRLRWAVIRNPSQGTKALRASLRQAA